MTIIDDKIEQHRYVYEIGKGIIDDLYNKHKALIDEEKYKDHKLIMDVYSNQLDTDILLIKVHMVHNETKEKVLIEDFEIKVSESVDIQILGIVDN